ncbi:sushi, von Willebrand factor type A, EGF and pentraxin domain-containing protein 1 [Hyalella azteca]|uniref:Sushi, von Willebrand factor type A, EGF and pentraxin domain-containing protein 1 n=1 Tax=Hyalella azteca TaxID=294128 RepID=A0A8B7NRA6_HYAAZ|nr:sushi, von Willebrand factor type A, EGF and pentraxin domain-containing protein 1 [Hyalella azteca]
MSVPNITENSVGTIVTYSCNDGYYLNTTEKFPGNSTAVTVTCDDGNWTYGRDDLQCVTICTDEPPAPIGSANSSWNNYTRINGTTVTYSCPNNEIFGNMNSTLNITCVNGTWTFFEEFYRTCSVPCNSNSPPETINNTIRAKNEGFREYEKIRYNCPPNTASLLGERYIELQCQPGSVWNVTSSTNETIEKISRRFKCLDSCPGPAVAPNTNWQSNWTSEFVNGTVIYYTCNSISYPNTSYLLSGDSGDGRSASDILCMGYQNTSYWQTEGGHVSCNVTRDSQTLINTCSNNSWTFVGIPYCLSLLPSTGC